jgi:lipoprotein-anchoring transpeptidase ErfK/SrfK
MANSEEKTVREPAPSTQTGHLARPTRSDARKQAVLARLVRREPDNEQAWLALAQMAQDAGQEMSFLRQALRINPRNPQAIRRLRQLSATPSPANPAYTQNSVEMTGDAPRESRDRLLRRWLAIWLLVAVCVVLLGGFVIQTWTVQSDELSLSSVTPGPSATPSATMTATATRTPGVPEQIATRIPLVEDAWKTRDWAMAVDVLNRIALLDSDYPGLREAECDTYAHWAGDLVQAGQVQEAYALFGQAYSVCGDQADAQEGRALALQYLSGQWRYEHERWGDAAAVLQIVYDREPNYAQTQELLFTAYLTTSHIAAGQSEFQLAHEACQAALKIRPDDARAIELCQAIRTQLTPTPTPTPANPLKKRIEVNISEQRMYVWQGDTLLYKWVCSTGEPGRGTAAGQYRVLDKIPEAWASTWSLRMPYWMGIYYAGSLENGIHALPILPNGQTLWAGYLGTPVSYGCVILSTENARALYSWADVGTPVWIHY